MTAKSKREGDRLLRMAWLIIVLGAALFPAPLARAESGPQIGKIRFEGNKAFKSRLLKEQMRKIEGQPDDSAQITNTDAKNVIDFYRDNGYLDAELLEIRRTPRPQDSTKIDYTLVIKESEPYTISEIDIVGAETFKETELKKLLVVKTGDVLKTAFMDYSEYLVREFYSRRGYIYCTVTDSLAPSPYVRKAKSLMFLIDEGVQTRVSSVGIDGNKNVRAKIIKREIVVRPGEIYNPGKAYESQRRIYGTGLFKDVKFLEIGREEKKETIDLVFVVKEERPKWVAFGGGYQSPYKMSSYVQWGHDNIFNNGQKLKLEASYTFSLEGEHEENFGVTHSEPYLFSSAFKGQLSLFHRRMYLQHYDLIESGGNARLGRYMGKNIEGFAQYQFKTSSVQIYEYVDDLLDIAGITNSVSLSFTRDTRDNLFDPRSGIFSSLRGDVAGGILGGDNSFYRYVGDITMFFNPLGDVVFATRARGGVIEPFGASTGVPLGERFPLRGTDAVRGYAEEDLLAGGNYLTTFNVEMRFPLFMLYSRYVGFAYFVDMGYASRIALRLDDHLSEMKIGAGAGIRAATPIGPVRLDYARNITGASLTDYGRIYFGIGHMF